MLGKRYLHNKAINIRIIVQLPDVLEQRLLRDVGWQPDQG
jgi:hypothetical protein